MTGPHDAVPGTADAAEASAMGRNQDRDLGDNRRRTVIAVLGAALGRAPAQEEIAAGEVALSRSGERATRGTEPWSGLPLRLRPGRVYAVLV